MPPEREGKKELEALTALLSQAGGPQINATDRDVFTPLKK